MTREEEIRISALKYLDNFVPDICGICDEDIYDAFIAGLDYADRHPKNVWHNPEEDPKEPKDLLLIETDGCVKVGYVKRTKSSIRWKTFGRKGEVAKWAYIDDLLSKEGGKE